MGEMQYELPRLDFIAGETQRLKLRVYFYSNRRPYDLSACEAEFAIINSVEKTGLPIFTKSATIQQDSQDPVTGFSSFNALFVELEPKDTVRLFGKFVYQVSIKDTEAGEMEQLQGVMYIRNNINKKYALG